MHKFILLIICAMLIASCSTTRSSGCAHPVERDLTQSWNDRVYWCAPQGYKNAPVKKVLYNDAIYSQPSIGTQAQAVIDYSVAIQSKSQNAGATNHVLNTVRFYWHDSKFDTTDIQALLSSSVPLKVRGCRLASEPSFLTFSRALRVRDELTKRGYTHKITILADNSCTGTKSVEVQ